MKATSAISVWKGITLSALSLMVFSFSSIAQCSGSLQSITYDTLVNGSGNDPHTFTFAKFNPALGTLSAVNISSVVSVNYGFTLTNINSSSVNFSVGVGRKDNIQSAVLSAPYSNTINADIGTFLLAPNETITEAPATVINRYNNDLDVTSNIIDFIGNDSIGFNYAPRTYANHSGSPTYQYNATANDTIHFLVTYFYCNSIVLVENLISFSASKENYKTVKLAWASINEQRSRIYEIEKSTDAVNFSTAGSVAAIVNPDDTGNYTYDYQTTTDEKTKLWFRLKITDTNGVAKYSSIKMVDMTDDFHAGIYLYPNPSDQFVNIVFNQSKNWQVDILATNGIILQRSSYNHANTAYINFAHRLSAGIYFARVIDQQTQKNTVLSFVVK